MAVTIFKYHLQVEGEGELFITMPAGAEVLCVQTQVFRAGTDGYERTHPHIWVKVDTESPLETRKFFIVGTGRRFPKKAGRYVGTYQVHDGEFVWHVFEEDVCKPSAK
jgi:hypothetical protein